MLHPANITHSVVLHLVLRTRVAHRVRAESAVVLTVFQSERALADVADFLLFPVFFVVLEIVVYIACVSRGYSR